MSFKIKTIKNKIFISNLFILFLAFLLSILTFNLVLNYYFQKQTKQQLANTAVQIEKNFEKITQDLQPTPKGKKNNKALNQYDKRFASTLGISDTHFFFLSQNGEILGDAPPVEDFGEEILYSENETIVYKKVEGYEHAFYKIGVPQNKNKIGSIVIYKNLQDTTQLKRGISGILLLIFIFAAGVTVILSSVISKRISNPISSVLKHINELSQRNYQVQTEKYGEDDMDLLVMQVNELTKKLKEYDESQKAFIQDASHDFRTPLMVIQSYVEGLKHGVISKEEKVYDLILEETNRLRDLVTDLLLLSKLETGDEPYTFETMSVNEFFENTSYRFEPLAKQMGKNLSLSLAEGELFIKMDKVKFVRATNNILDNCLRFARNQVKVEVVGGTQTVEIRISDDGEGFREEDLPFIFQRHFKGQKGKTGLGLAITKVIIEKHGGAISAKNTSQGAQFSILIPLV